MGLGGEEARRRVVPWQPGRKPAPLTTTHTAARAGVQCGGLGVACWMVVAPMFKKEKRRPPLEKGAKFASSSWLLMGHALQ